MTVFASNQQLSVNVMSCQFRMITYGCLSEIHRTVSICDSHSERWTDWPQGADEGEGRKNGLNFKKIRIGEMGRRAGQGIAREERRIHAVPKAHKILATALVTANNHCYHCY